MPLPSTARNLLQRSRRCEPNFAGTVERAMSFFVDWFCLNQKGYFQDDDGDSFTVERTDGQEAEVTADLRGLAELGCSFKSTWTPSTCFTSSQTCSSC